MYVLIPSVILVVLLSCIPSSKGLKFFWWRHPSLKRSSHENRNATDEIIPVKDGIRFGNDSTDMFSNPFKADIMNYNSTRNSTDNIAKYTEIDSIELKKKIDKNFTTAKSKLKYFHEYLKSPFRPFAFFGQSKQRTYHQKDLKPHNLVDLPTLIPVLTNFSTDADLFMRFRIQGI